MPALRRLQAGDVMAFALRTGTTDVIRVVPPSGRFAIGFASRAQGGDIGGDFVDGFQLCRAQGQTLPPNLALPASVTVTTLRPVLIRLIFLLHPAVKAGAVPGD